MLVDQGVGEVGEASEVAFESLEAALHAQALLPDLDERLLQEPQAVAPLVAFLDARQDCVDVHP